MFFLYSLNLIAPAQKNVLKDVSLHTINVREHIRVRQSKPAGIKRCRILPPEPAAKLLEYSPFYAQRPLAAHSPHIPKRLKRRPSYLQEASTF